jgi:hypothetical protein|tara:strand:+ start:57 stop:242 length:186 start_codon:yes stop_codon:yes gene_type:complete
MTTLEQFTTKAQTLNIDELIVLGRELLKIDAPQVMLDELINIAFVRDGAAASARMCDGWFA